MELWLIRHALPVRIDRGEGPADPGLSEEGLDQARRLSERWAPYGADHCYVSPMRRARETAEPLAAALSVAPIVVDDLREFDAHLPTYIPIEELRADPAAWAEAVESWTSPEAEATRQEFRRTVVAAIDAIAEAHRGRDPRVAVVCHGGVINAYLAHLLGIHEDMFFLPAHASVTRLRRLGHQRVLESLNDRDHLTSAEPSLLTY